jgi:serine/threonine-protein kinase RsbW
MRPTASEALALRTSEVIYPGAAEHIRAVRADLRPLLADCPRADDVILCASELAANAALHSDSRLPGGTFTVRVAIGPCDHVRIEVEDNGGPWTPVPSDTERHHGLGIISLLATDWGIDGGDQASRTAWARFDWPARS